MRIFPDLSRRPWWKKALRILAWSTLGVATTLVATVAIALYVMGRQDAEHARFYETGSSINAFLSDYAKAMKDGGKVGDYYATGFSSPGRGRWVLRSEASNPDVVRWKLEPEGDRDGSRDSVLHETAEYLAALASVQDVKCKIDMIEQADPARDVVLRVKYILMGTDRDGRLVEDRYFYRWTLANRAKSGKGFSWVIVRDELIEGVRVGGDGRGFVEAKPDLIGIDFEHVRDKELDASNPRCGLKFGVIEHAMGGISAVDYDGDGLPDLFFADGKRCRLYHNEGTGPDGIPRFRDATVEANLDGIDRANSGLFVDVDNDGDKDLVVIRYLAPNKLFLNNGNVPYTRFTDRSREMGFDLSAPSLAVCALDYDQDGFLDLYLAVYGDAKKAIPRLPFFAQNGGKNRLLRNDGGKRFVDVTESSGVGDTGWSMAVAAADYDGDGRPDLAVANDFGRKNLYRNNGDGTFAEVAKGAGVLDFSGGMGLAFGDLDGDGRIDLYTSNINSNQRWFGEDMTIGQYFRNAVRTGWAVRDFGEYRKLYGLLEDRWRELGKMVGEGNSLFHNNGDGTFTELKDSHANRAGWGWGVALFDMDNDCDTDVYAANGWISNRKNTDL